MRSSTQIELLRKISLMSTRCSTNCSALFWIDSARSTTRSASEGSLSETATPTLTTLTLTEITSYLPLTTCSMNLETWMTRRLQLINIMADFLVMARTLKMVKISHLSQVDQHEVQPRAVQMGYLKRMAPGWPLIERLPTHRCATLDSESLSVQSSPSIMSSVVDR